MKKKLMLFLLFVIFLTLLSTTGIVFAGGEVGMQSIIPKCTDAECSEISIDSVDRAAFVTDVTIPDGTELAPDTIFTKTWMIKNTGNTTWGTDYKLVMKDGEKMTSVNEIPLNKKVVPGNAITIDVIMTAPKQPGTYITNWMLKTEMGDTFGVGSDGQQPIWVKITITSRGGRWYDSFVDPLESVLHTIKTSLKILVNAIKRIVFPGGKTPIAIQNTVGLLSKTLTRAAAILPFGRSQVEKQFEETATPENLNTKEAVSTKITDPTMAVSVEETTVVTETELPVGNVETVNEKTETASPAVTVMPDISTIHSEETLQVLDITDIHETPEPSLVPELQSVDVTKVSSSEEKIKKEDDLQILDVQPVQIGTADARSIPSLDLTYISDETSLSDVVIDANNNYLDVVPVHQVTLVPETMPELLITPVRLMEAN